MWVDSSLKSQRTFGVSSLEKPLDPNVAPQFKKLASAIYLQVSIVSQALIFVTRSRSFSFIERPGFLLGGAFLIAQLVSQLSSLPLHFISLEFVCTFLSPQHNFYSQIATLIAVYANWNFAAIEGIGWGWAGVIWLYNIVFYFPLDLIKFFIRYALSGKAWDLVIEQRVRKPESREC